ncbi:MAG: 30S ribosomal protein S7 [Alphaproteobacteria bacterium]|nr:30S ribosomal protein S7 [Alphaproteobacteria bacterium]
MRRPIKKKRILSPDPQYKSTDVAKLINYIMERGKKNIARTIVYDAFAIIAQETKKEPLEVFREALHNVGPTVELKSKRIGGANYQVPTEVKPERRLVLSLRWMIEAAHSKKGVRMAQKLAEEIIASSKNEGVSITKRENVQKMAEANRAFAHLAW